jgi:phenylacetate-CoA ligase
MRAQGLHGIKDDLYQRAFNRLVLNSFVLTEKTLPDYVRRLNAFAPKIVVGYVAPLALMARWAQNEGVKLHRPQAVITGAEALSGVEREQIEAAFGAPVFETYGCREVMLLGCECEQRKGMHITADHLLLETVDALGRPVIGETGEVCITDLHNRAMPMFRYINGDLALRSDRVCACGRGLPLLEKVDGRTLDVIRTVDGTLVTGEFFIYAMLPFPYIRRFQVVQHELASVEVRLVNDTPLTESQRAALTESFRVGLGPNCAITLNQVDEIPLTASGKQRVTLSMINGSPHGVAA